APDGGELVVQLNPTAASAALDALPSLVEQPYHSPEQTVQRFVPALLLAHALSGAGVDLAALRERLRSRPAASACSPVDADPGVLDAGPGLDSWRARAERRPVV